MESILQFPGSAQLQGKIRPGLGTPLPDLSGGHGPGAGPDAPGDADIRGYHRRRGKIKSSSGGLETQHSLFFLELLLAAFPFGIPLPDDLQGGFAGVVQFGAFFFFEEKDHRGNEENQKKKDQNPKHGFFC
jgi:hypothetical protein